MASATKNNCLVVLALVALTPVACKKGDDHPASAVAAAPADAAPTTQPDAAVEPAVAASEVAGAFLADVKCGDFDASTAATNLLSDIQFLGCILRDPADGKRLAGLKNYQLTLTLDDGSKVEVTTKDTGEDVGWHFGFDIPKATHDHLKALAASAEAPPGRGGGNAKDASYDWANDPQFAEFLHRAGEALFHAFHVQPGADCKIPDNFSANGLPPRRVFPYPPDFLASPYQIAFVTSERQPANLGVAGADAVCARDGQSLDPMRKYRAVLSTSQQDAKDHVKIRGPVFNTLGYPFAADAADFWTLHPQETITGDDIATEAAIPYGVFPASPPLHGHFHSSLFSACGVRVHELYNTIFPAVFEPSEVSAWTGTKPGGTYDAAGGACKDWTSNEGGETGGIGRVYAADEELFRKGNDPFRVCSAKGFFICVSE